MPDPFLLGLAIGVVILGAIVQSLIGFGLAVVAAPLLYFIDPQLVPVPLMILGFSISLINWFYNRRNANLKAMGYALIARVPGALIGLALLVYFNQKGLQILIAIAVLMGVATTLTDKAIRFNHRNLAIAGLLSGIFATVAAIGGPPIAMLLRDQQAGSIRGNLSAFFSVSTLISAAVLIAGGKFQIHHLVSGITLLPGVFIGFFISKQFISRFNSHHIKVTTQIVCSLSALMLLYQAVVN
ncbi:sulfite exporter TauE/SafE family protein [Celerinatantimonas sp. MCCC 1A17872]|uniref:sulfite exporter TauE/SafE family protein n=1 Tax=Celerinatantimonas sp. MCCC 1A17872 TaxID=3177514 RepID=UPI0038C63952